MDLNVTGLDQAGGVRLSDIKVGERDGRNRFIMRVLAEATDRYVVYRAVNAPQLSSRWTTRRYQEMNSRICVQLSDSPQERGEQLKKLSEVNELRTKVGGLINGRWRHPYFERAFAEALGMAAEFDLEGAKRRLTDLLVELEHESLLIGQAFQMAFSCIAWAVFIGVLFGFSHHNPITNPTVNYWLAAKGGATGALFSIATMFSKRSLAPDTKKIRIALEATVRVGCGVIAGGALLLALSSGILVRPMGGETTNLVANWMFVVVIGFLAGFVERMVPDLFEAVKLDQGNIQPPGVGGTAGGPKPA